VLCRFGPGSTVSATSTLSGSFPRTRAGAMGETLKHLLFVGWAAAVGYLVWVGLRLWLSRHTGRVFRQPVPDGDPAVQRMPVLATAR
jgi:hypothetical protein